MGVLLVYLGMRMSGLIWFLGCCRREEAARRPPTSPSGAGLVGEGRPELVGRHLKGVMGSS